MSRKSCETCVSFFPDDSCHDEGSEWYARRDVQGHYGLVRFDPVPEEARAVGCPLWIDFEERCNPSAPAGKSYLDILEYIATQAQASPFDGVYGRQLEIRFGRNGVLYHPLMRAHARAHVTLPGQNGEDVADAKGSPKASRFHNHDIVGITEAGVSFLRMMGRLGDGGGEP